MSSGIKVPLPTSSRPVVEKEREGEIKQNKKRFTNLQFDRRHQKSLLPTACPDKVLKPAESSRGSTTSPMHLHQSFQGLPYREVSNSETLPLSWQEPPKGNLLPLVQCSMYLVKSFQDSHITVPDVVQNSSWHLRTFQRLLHTTL